MPKVKDIPACPVLPSALPSSRVMREYRIRLVTPLFGGGVDAGEPDPTFPVRGTSIRGQLQFWWRATRGASCATPGELFERHTAVWGSTDRASPVDVEVTEVRASAAKSCARYRWNQKARGGKGGWSLAWEPPFERTALSYALFPFQGQPPSQPRPDGLPERLPASFVENCSFTLRLRFPDERWPDVESAMRAWVNFGGIGARTRRGCGALLCEELAPQNASGLPEWFRSTFPATSSDERDWPTLPDRLVTRLHVGTPISEWSEVIEMLRYFRQAEGFARNPGQNSNRPGRSRYPEPETIREVPGSGSNRGISGHQRLAHIPADGFPRAELGLPIVFHFQGRGEPPGKSDLPDLTLYPDNGPAGTRRDRMASPLILKPLALASGEAVPLIMRLATPRLTGVDLRQGDASLPLPGTTIIQDPRLAAYRDSPLAQSRSGSALEAFIALALDPSRGFQEIVR